MNPNYFVLFVGKNKAENHLEVNLSVVDNSVAFVEDLEAGNIAVDIENHLIVVEADNIELVELTNMAVMMAEVAAAVEDNIVVEKKDKVDIQDNIEAVDMVDTVEGFVVVVVVGNIVVDIVVDN